VCSGELLVTRLECSACGTDVTGRFTLGALAGLREPHASLIEMFLRKHGNVKEMERELGLSYPTVRARLEEALEAAGFPKGDSRAPDDPDAWEKRFEAGLEERIRARVEQQLAMVEQRLSRSQMTMAASRRAARAQREEDLAAERATILDRLEQGEIAADEAAGLLRALKERR
jgi:hypothetical protein